MVDFIVIGHHNVLSYNIMHPLFRLGKINYGYNDVSNYEGGKLAPGRWFSNISDYNPPLLDFNRKYVEGDYKYFDECSDCINVDSKKDIPDGYFGMMGIPGNAVKYINRSQFEILGVAHRGVVDGDLFTPYVNGEFKFTRWIIKRK